MTKRDENEDIKLDKMTDQEFMLAGGYGLRRLPCTDFHFVVAELYGWRA